MQESLINIRAWCEGDPRLLRGIIQNELYNNNESKIISVITLNSSSEHPWLNASPIVFFAKASRGEERTFALLKKLPDDYLIYYEPNIDNRHPDFIVIAPDLAAPNGIWPPAVLTDDAGVYSATLTVALDSATPLIADYLAKKEEEREAAMAWMEALRLE